MYIMTDSRDFRGEIAFQLCDIQSFENCMFFYSYSKHGLDVSCLITPRQSHFAISPGIKEGRVFPRAAEETSFHRLARVGHQAKQNRWGNLEQHNCLSKYSSNEYEHLGSKL